jgi:hypothetical protein
MTKKFLLILFTSVLLIGCRDEKPKPVKIQEPQGPVAEMSFEEETYDFGTVIVGDTLSHTFSFTNTGDIDLVITKAKGNCGCTVADYPKDPIAPGQKGEIKVDFNTSAKLGQHRKSVFISANVDKGTKRLYVKADIRPRNQAGKINKQ